MLGPTQRFSLRYFLQIFLTQVPQIFLTRLRYFFQTSDISYRLQIFLTYLRYFLHTSDISYIPQIFIQTSDIPSRPQLFLTDYRYFFQILSYRLQIFLTYLGYFPVNFFIFTIPGGQSWHNEFEFYWIQLNKLYRKNTGSRSTFEFPSRVNLSSLSQCCTAWQGSKQLVYFYVQDQLVQQG